jgi:hypothetical protein
LKNLTNPKFDADESRVHLSAFFYLKVWNIPAHIGMKVRDVVFPVNSRTHMLE